MQYSFSEAYAIGLKKVDYLRNTLSEFPHITKEGKWLTNQNGHWTGGFWTGLLWLESLQVKSVVLQESAKQWALRLRCRIGDSTTHDQGFIFGPSCVFGYRITKDPELVPLIHAGAENLIRQYVPQTGLIQAWAEQGYDGISIVDTIMNLPILWISGELGDDPTRKELSLHVARTIQKHAIRPDFSSYHVVKWDKTFQLSGDTHQGYSSQSCWSRGQAWALYGFANMYRYTGQFEFFDTALGLAEYFWSHLNQNHLPAWDFTFRDNTQAPTDASAASIAASGMALIAELYAQKGNDQQSSLWGRRADTILSAETEHCLYQTMEDYGIIRNVVVDLPHNSGINESAMYGDYYFMEGLYRRLHASEPAALSLLY